MGQKKILPKNQNSSTTFKSLDGEKIGKKDEKNKKLGKRTKRTKKNTTNLGS